MIEDPCAGAEPRLRSRRASGPAYRRHSTVNLPESPGGSYNELWGGNPLLDPEIADTLTAGVVWTPRSIRGLSVTLDYYNIDITEAIGEYRRRRVASSLCTTTGEARYCDRIHRDEQYTLWLTEDGIHRLDEPEHSNESREGVDLDFNYLLGLGGAGYLVTDLMGSYLLESRFADPIVDFDCAGYYGWVCGFPSPVWRHRFRATWESNFRLNLSLAWRYMHSVENE